MHVSFPKWLHNSAFPSARSPSSGDYLDPDVCEKSLFVDNDTGTSEVKAIAVPNGIGDWQSPAPWSEVFRDLALAGF